jgi:hypothetical protein
MKSTLCKAFAAKVLIVVAVFGFFSAGNVHAELM